MTELRTRVRDKRKQMGATQAQIAKAASMSLRAYGMFETGQSTPQGENLQAILRAVGLDEAEADEAQAESTREGWPLDIRVFLDMLGAYLMTMDVERRLDFIHRETRRIITDRP